MPDVITTVQSHYTQGSILERIFAHLKDSGIDADNLSAEDLYPLDQLHGRGIIATQEHAEFAGLGPGMHVLDLGAGVGGASRFIASVCNCQVTGVDLTQEFVDVARELTARCGLADRIEFHQGDALALPFDDAVFDHVWSHNVTMNIEDKTGLAREVGRVLKPGGHFSCSEINLGPTGDLHFPVPWANDPSSSFLVTPDEMKSALEAGGLKVLQQIDLNEANLAFMKEVRERAERGEPPKFLNHVVMGDDFMDRLANNGKNVVEGRTVEQLTIAEKV